MAFIDDYNRMLNAQAYGGGAGIFPIGSNNSVSLMDQLSAILGGTGDDGTRYVNYLSHPNAPRGFGNPNSPVSENSLSTLGSLFGGANSFAQSLGGWGNLLQGIGSLYSMYKGIGLAEDQLDLARDQFNFGRNYSSAQLNNNIDSYNTALADRARTRAFTETGNQNAYNDWYEKNKLDSFRG